MGKPKTRYQRPGPDAGQLLTESDYEAPDEPSVPDVLETTAEDTLERSETAVPEVLPEPHHVNLSEAVPVRVVNFTRELDRVTGFTARQYTIAALGSVTIPGRRNRTRLVLSNSDGTLSVYFGHEDIRNAGVGYPLLPGKEVEQFHQGTIYVHNADDTDSVIIGVHEEYVTELR